MQQFQTFKTQQKQLMKVFRDILIRNNGNGQIGDQPLVTNEVPGNGGGGVTPIVAASSSGIQVQPIAAKLDKAVLLEKCNKLLPSKYHGIEEPDQALYWLEKMAKHTISMGLDDTIRAEFTAYKLVDKAGEGWKGKLAYKYCHGRLCTWEEFSKDFTSEYFPSFMKDEKRREFVSISQKPGESVCDYTNRFGTLENHVPHFFNNDMERSKMYVEGLNGCLRTKVLIGKPTGMEEAIELANVLDLDFQQSCEQAQQRSTIGKNINRDNNDAQGGGRTPKKQKIEGKIAQANPKCKFCGELHFRRFCPKMLGKCFNCHKTGHMAKLGEKDVRASSSQ